MSTTEPTQDPAQEPTAEELGNRIVELLEFVGEGGTLKTLAGMSGEDMEAIYAVAFNYYNAKKYDKAHEMFQFLCLNDHAEPRWYYGLGVVRQAMGDFQGAVNAYGMATLFDIENPAPHAQAGYCLLAMGKPVEAKAALEGAIIACGDDPENESLKTQAQSLLKTIAEQGAVSA